MGFVLTQKAREDLVAIARFTQERWNKAQRNIYLKQLDDAFQLLGQKPGTGKACDYIKVGYRKFPQGRHVIFYRLLDDARVEIVRILHKQMDVGSHMVPAS